MPLQEIIMAMAMAVGAQSPDQATRTALLDAARQPVAQALGKPVLFKVRQLRTAGRWAFLLADMEGQDGRPVDYAGTPKADAAAHGLASRAYAALLRQDGERWTVVDQAVAPTDVAWAAWPARHGAPEALIQGH